MSHLIAALIGSALGGLIVVVSGDDTRSLVGRAFNYVSDLGKLPEHQASYVAGVAIYQALKQKIDDEDFVWREIDLEWGRYLAGQMQDQFHDAAILGSGRAARLLSEWHRCTIPGLVEANPDRAERYSALAEKHGIEPLRFEYGEDMDC